MARTIDLNLDAGELEGQSDAFLGLATSLNVGLGAYAGSEELTRATVDQARRLGLAWGLHPGYGDRPGFGRRGVATLLESGFSEAELWEGLEAQVGTFLELKPQYLKAHGALFNESAEPSLAARWLAGLAVRAGVPLVGLAGTQHELIAGVAGVRFIAEGYADRAYLPDGRLMPRGEPGAVLFENAACAAQAVRLAQEVGVETVCLHSDHEGAEERTRAVRTALEEAGWRLQASMD